LKINTLKIKKLPLTLSIIGFSLLAIGFLVISNKNLGFVFVDFLSNIKKISPYFLFNNSFPIYKQWLEQFYIYGYIIIVLGSLFLFFSLIIALELKYSKIYYLIFIFFLTFIISYYFSIIGTDPVHDGAIFKPAIDIVEGKILFKDSFLQYGPLTSLLQALAILIFGKYLIVIKLLTSLFYSIISVLLWIIFSRLMSKFLNTFFCIIWILLAPFYFSALPWSSVYALFFQMLALYFLIIFIERKKFLYLFLTGASVSLTFWCRQPVGVFLFILIIFFIIFLKFLLKNNTKFLLKSIILFISGFISISLLFIIWLLMSNSLKDWWLQNIIHSIKWNSWRVDANDIGPIKLLLRCLFVIGYNYSFIWQLFPIVNLIIFVVYLAKLFKKRILEKKEIITLSIVFVSFASWLQYYPGPGAAHAFWAATPMIGLSIYFVWKFIETLINLIYIKIRDRHKDKFIYQNRESKTIYLLKITTTLIMLFLIFSGCIGENIEFGFSRLEKNQILINSPKVLKGLQFNKDDAIKYYRLGKIIEIFTENIKGINLITTGDAALYLTFQENNENFSPMYCDLLLFNLLLYPDYKEKLNNYIINKRPLIIMNRGQFVPDYYEIYSWDNYFISIPLEMKYKYFMFFQNKNLKNSYKLSKEQEDSLDNSLLQQIALYGKEKLSFNSLFFDNYFKLIPMSYKSDLWLNPLIEHKIPLSDIIVSFINSKTLKPILATYDDEEFIRFLYLFILNREPDEGGLVSWTDNLKNGLKRDQAIKGFFDTDEWKNIEVSLINNSKS
jgi:hypothetical protein